VVDLDGVPTTRTRWQRQFRIVPSKFPPISVFERLVSPKKAQDLFHLESLTNQRLLGVEGNLGLVKQEDWRLGPGCSPLMAAFTHPRSSRFSDGSFGIYYCARNVDTAIEETRFHRSRFMLATKQDPCDVDMRVYVGSLNNKSLLDIRNGRYEGLLHPDVERYPLSQTFGQQIKDSDAWGLVFPSVRHRGGQCVAAFRPPAASCPVQGQHLIYRWDGNTIAEVFEATRLI